MGLVTGTAGYWGEIRILKGIAMKMTHLGGVQVLDLQDGRVDSPGLDSCRTWETVEEDWGWGQPASRSCWRLSRRVLTPLEALTSASCLQQDAAGGTLKSAFLVLLLCFLSAQVLAAQSQLIWKDRPERRLAV